MPLLVISVAYFGSFGETQYAHIIS